MTFLVLDETDQEEADYRFNSHLSISNYSTQGLTFYFYCY